MIYELLALAASEDPEMRLREADRLLSEMTWKASREFEEGIFRLQSLDIVKSLKRSPKTPLLGS